MKKRGMINRDNYEAFMLDYLEGTLSSEVEQELVVFLSENPDLQADDSILEVTVPVDEHKFPGKERLKRSSGNKIINRDNFEQFCIAGLEDDLDEESGRMLEDFLKENPELVKEFKIYSKLKLHSDNKLRCFFKNDLKNISSTGPGLIKSSTRLIALHRIFFTAAASVAILISGYLIFFSNENVEEISSLSVSPVAENINNSGSNNVSPRSELIQQPEDEPVLAFSNSKEAITGAEIVTPEEDILVRVTESNNYSVHRTVENVVDARPPVPPVMSGFRNHVPVLASVSDATKTGLRPVRASEEKSEYLRGHEEMEEVTLFASLIDNINSRLGNNRELDKVSIWDVADAGVKGINSFAGSELLVLDREYDEHGDMVSLALASPVLSFSRR